MYLSACKHGKHIEHDDASGSGVMVPPGAHVQGDPKCGLMLCWHYFEVVNNFFFYIYPSFFGFLFYLGHHRALHIPGLGGSQRRERLAIPVFWPGELYGLYSPWGVTKSWTRLSD